MSRPLTVFLVVPAENRYQTTEMFIMRALLEKGLKQPQGPPPMILDSVFATTFWAMHYLHFEPTLAPLIIGRDDPKTALMLVDAAWFGTCVAQVLNSDVVVTEGNDVVMYPGVATLQGISTAVGVPNVMWRNDARLLWNNRMDPLMAGAAWPYWVNSVTPNQPLEEMRGETVVNNIADMVREALSADPRVAVSSLPPRLARAYRLGEVLLPAVKAAAEAHPRDMLAQAKAQYAAIKAAVAEAPYQYFLPKDVRAMHI